MGRLQGLKHAQRLNKGPSWSFTSASPPPPLSTRGFKWGSDTAFHASACEAASEPHRVCTQYASWTVATGAVTGASGWAYICH